MEILIYFPIMIFASLLDPIQTTGYIISGLFIKNLIGALVASIIWNVLLYITIVAPTLAQEQSSFRSDIFFASWLGAILLTGIVYLFASHRRNKKQRDMVVKKDNQSV